MYVCVRVRVCVCGGGGRGGGGITASTFLLLVRPGKVAWHYTIGHPSLSLKCFLNNRLCCPVFVYARHKGQQEPCKTRLGP